VTGNGESGLEANQRDLAKLVWRVIPRKGDFDDATFDRTAASFDTLITQHRDHNYYAGG